MPRMASGQPTAASAVALRNVPANYMPRRSKLHMLRRSEAGLRCVPQILDGARDECRVAHVDQDDDGDGDLKERVEEQDEEAQRETTRPIPTSRRPRKSGLSNIDSASLHVCARLAVSAPPTVASGLASATACCWCSTVASRASGGNISMTSAAATTSPANSSLPTLSASEAFHKCCFDRCSSN